MANGNDIDMEKLTPVLLIGGAGLLIYAMSRKPGGGGTPTGYCVPDSVVQQLMNFPGAQPASFHSTSICRYYAATSSQQQHFWTLDSSLKNQLMAMSAEEALWFTCWSCATG